LTEKALSIVVYVWFGVSAAMLIGWLGLVRRRRGALGEAPARSHDLRLIDVMCAGLAYVAALLAAGQVLAGVDYPSAWRYEASFAVMTAGQVVAAAVAIWIARARFAGGLAGWGLTGRGLGRAVGLSTAYFVAAAGLMFAVLAVTIQICRAFGHEQVQQHEFLKLLEEHKLGVSSTSLLIVSAVVTGPLAEELLFRGILQSFLIAVIAGAAATPYRRSIDAGNWTINKCRWAGIVIAASAFAMFHNWQHWPALFVLGVVLGYGYERHGSLWVAILAHGMFNLVSIGLTLAAIRIR